MFYFLIGIVVGVLSLHMFREFISKRKQSAENLCGRILLQEEYTGSAHKRDLLDLTNMLFIREIHETDWPAWSIWTVQELKRQRDGSWSIRLRDIEVWEDSGEGGEQYYEIKNFMVDWNAFAKKISQGVYSESEAKARFEEATRLTAQFVPVSDELTPLIEKIYQLALEKRASSMQVA